MVEKIVPYSNLKLDFKPEKKEVTYNNIKSVGAHNNGEPMAEKVTVSIIKADIGSICGHMTPHPSM